MNIVKILKELPFIELIFNPILTRNAKINYLSTFILSFLFTFVYLNSRLYIGVMLLVLGLFLIIGIKMTYSISLLTNKFINSKNRDLKILLYYIRFMVYFLLGMSISLLVLSYA